MELSDRDLGAQPLGPPIDFGSAWGPDDASPSQAKPPNNVEVRAMLPQPVYRAMQVLVHREDTPFAAPSDIVRAAVWHYLRAVQKAIDERHPVYVDALHREQLRANNEQMAQEHAKLGETLEHMHDQLTALLDSGRPGVREIERRLAENAGLAELLGDYWRGVYTDAVADMAVVKTAKDIIDGTHSGASPRDPRAGADPAANAGLDPDDRREDTGVPDDSRADSGDRKGDSEDPATDDPDCEHRHPTYGTNCT